MELDIKQYKEQVALGEALKRLEAVPEFNQIITEGYCQANSDALVASLSYMANEEIRNKQFDKLLSISHFRQYIRMVRDTAERAREALDELEGAE